MKQVLRWQKPRRIFVGSMTDLFYNAVPDEFLDTIFGYMAVAKQHTFLLLTKRPERMLAYLIDSSIARCDGRGETARRIDPRVPLEYLSWPLPNIWLGVTVEDQQRADERIPILLETPAAKRFVSIEPMLGPVMMRRISKPAGERYPWGYDYLTGVEYGPYHCNRGMPRLDWVIVGGESGPNARPMHPDWARSLRDQCQEAGTPFFFKQWGGRFGKRAAGRLLDGVEYNAFPEVPA